MAHQKIEDDGIRLMNLDASFSDLRESLDPSHRESLTATNPNPQETLEQVQAERDQLKLRIEQLV